MRLLPCLVILVGALTAQNRFGLRPSATSSKFSEELRARTTQNGEQLDVIVQWNEDAPASGRASRFRTARRDFDGTGHSAMRMNRSELAALAEDPEVAYISPDREVGATHFPPWMLKEAVGYRFAAMTTPERPVQTGQGIGIAIIDSGIAPDAYLKDGANGCTASRIVYSQNFVVGESTTNDVYGHGTHVAGITAGTGLCLPGAYVDFSGMAPRPLAFASVA